MSTVSNSPSPDSYRSAPSCFSRCTVLWSSSVWSRLPTRSTVSSTGRPSAASLASTAATSIASNSELPFTFITLSPAAKPSPSASDPGTTDRMTSAPEDQSFPKFMPRFGELRQALTSFPKSFPLPTISSKPLTRKSRCALDTAAKSRVRSGKMSEKHRPPARIPKLFADFSTCIRSVAVPRSSLPPESGSGDSPFCTRSMSPMGYFSAFDPSILDLFFTTSVSLASPTKLRVRLPVWVFFWLNLSTSTPEVMSALKPSMLACIDDLTSSCPRGSEAPCRWPRTRISFTSFCTCSVLMNSACPSRSTSSSSSSSDSPSPKAPSTPTRRSSSSSPDSASSSLSESDSLSPL
mmetsp:Transcript_51341/g.116744  ORF Transcript_51341/g.116744 Transcript_51341/m.116744 type:complete len:350 (-) Transcript_51341:1566-2615(-)